MTFIIALGVIIILLCSASVFRIIQPNTPPQQRMQKKGGGKNKPTTSNKPQVSHTSSVKKTEDSLAPIVNNHEPAHLVENVESKAHVEASLANVPNTITLHLAADLGRPYAGYELLQTLLTCGMRFGTMSLFHRHVKKTGVGPILFSLAACTEDGSFDLTKIGGFSCNGLVLFMKPKSVESPLQVFEMMLNTADQLINELGGKVLNEKQQLLKKTEVMTLYGHLHALEKSTEGISN